MVMVICDDVSDDATDDIIINGVTGDDIRIRYSFVPFSS